MVLQRQRFGAREMVALEAQPQRREPHADVVRERAAHQPRQRRRRAHRGAEEARGDDAGPDGVLVARPVLAVQRLQLVPDRLREAHFAERVGREGARGLATDQVLQSRRVEGLQHLLRGLRLEERPLAQPLRRPGRQVAQVRKVDDLAARRHQPRVGGEDGLGENRSAESEIHACSREERKQFPRVRSKRLGCYVSAGSPFWGACASASAAAAAPWARLWRTSAATSSRSSSWRWFSTRTSAARSRSAATPSLGSTPSDASAPRSAGESGATASSAWPIHPAPCGSGSGGGATQPSSLIPLCSSENSAGGSGGGASAAGSSGGGASKAGSSGGGASTAGSSGGAPPTAASPPPGPPHP